MKKLEKIEWTYSARNRSFGALYIENIVKKKNKTKNIIL